MGAPGRPGSDWHPRHVCTAPGPSEAPGHGGARSLRSELAVPAAGLTDTCRGDPVPLAAGRVGLQPVIHLSQVELSQHRSEVLVVEDLLEDLFVGVDTGDDGLKELLVEDQAEVIEAVVLRLV